MSTSSGDWSSTDPVARLPRPAGHAARETGQPTVRTVTARPQRARVRTQRTQRTQRTAPLCRRHALAALRPLCRCALLAITLLGSALLAASPVNAELPSDLRGLPIVEAEVVGEAALLTNEQALGIPIGQPLTRDLLRSLLAGLLDGDQWVNAQIDAVAVAGGVKLRLSLEPRVTISRTQLSGNDVLDAAAIDDALSLGPDGNLTRDELPAMAARLRRLYADQGHLNASVELSLRDTDNPAQKVLMVDIAEGSPARIRRIRFTGQEPSYPPRVAEAMGLHVGQAYDRKQLDEAVERGGAFLRRQGYLEAHLKDPIVTLVRARADIEIPAFLGPRYEVRIQGFEPLTVSDAHDALSLTSRPLTRGRFRRRLQDALVDLFRKRGFMEAKVEVRRLRGQAPNTAVLHIRIEPGARVEVVAVAFAGARHFSRAFLRDQLFSYLDEELPGTGLLRAVDAEVADVLLHGQDSKQARATPPPLSKTPRRTYYEAAYLRATEHVGDLYRAEGFLSVRIGAPRLKRVGKDRAAVTIPVIEGPRTYLHGLHITGNGVMTARQLAIETGLLRNQPFSYLALEDARLRIIAAYQEQGHMFASVEPSVRFSADQTRADVTLAISEGYPVHIGEVIVTGAERTDENYLRRVLSLSPGDVYRPSAARKSEQNLQNLGVFSGVNVSLAEPELRGRVKRVIVEVSERKTQYLNVTAGVSTGQGVRGGFEYGYRNLFGQAVDLALRVQLAHQLFFVDQELGERFKSLTSLNQRIERRVSLGIVIPRTFGLSGVRTAFDLVHLRDNERDFGTDKNGLGVTVTYLPSRALTTTVGADVENNNVDLFVDSDLANFLASTSDLRLRRLLRVPEGDTTLVALRASASYDLRDNPFTPTRGSFISLQAEVARTLSEKTVTSNDIESTFFSEFLKLALTVNGYLPLTDSIVLASQARIGRIFHLSANSRTYPNRAFFLGGVDTMRGYLQDAMVPQDLADRVLIDPTLGTGSIVRAGDAFVLARGELRFPLYDSLRGGVFLDMGNLWAEAENLWPFSLRPSIGAGIRLSTPVGPVAVDYGILLRPRESLREPFGTLHFSIGLF